MRASFRKASAAALLVTVPTAYSQVFYEQTGPWSKSAVKYPSVSLEDQARRKAFDTRLTEYLQQMESIRVLRGDRSSQRLVQAWESARGPAFNAAVASAIIADLSDDLPWIVRGVASVLFIMPGAPGDVKRSTLPASFEWSQDTRGRAKLVGNSIAGALSIDLGASAQTTSALAGLVQLKQDIGYARSLYSRGACNLIACIGDRFSDHLPFFDDPTGLKQTTSGRNLRSADLTLQRVARVKELIHNTSGDRPSRSGMEGKGDVSNRSSSMAIPPRQDPTPDRWASKQRTAESPDAAPKYRYGDVMSDAPYVMCVAPPGCDGPDFDDE